MIWTDLVTIFFAQFLSFIFTVFETLLSLAFGAAA